MGWLPVSWEGFLLSLLQLPQLPPEGNLLPLIQNKLWETVHSWITFYAILSELSGQHHTEAVNCFSSFFCFEESAGQMEIIFLGSKLVPSLICSTVRAAGGFNLGTSARDGFRHPLLSVKSIRLTVLLRHPKEASLIDQSRRRREGADVMDHQQTARDGKIDVLFYAFKARRSNQILAKERENPSLYLKAEKSYAESLGALELNTC